MGHIRVTTSLGNVYIIRDATYFAGNIIGHTDSDLTRRVFVIKETDELEQVR